MGGDVLSSQTKRESAITDEITADRNQCEVGEQRADAALSRDEETKPPTRQYSCDTKVQGKHWLEYGVFLTGIGSIIIACIAACFSWYQGWVARDAEQRSLRAYMIVTDLGVFCPDCGDTVLTGPAFPDMKNSVRFRIENGGQTPASDVTTTTNWIPVYDVSPAVTLPDGFAFLDHTKKEPAFASTSDVGRDHHKDVAGPIPDSDIATFKDAAAQKFTLFIYGHVDYCDVFDQPHSTAFCFRYIPNAGLHLPICDRFNGEIPPRGRCKATDR